MFNVKEFLNLLVGFWDVWIIDRIEIKFETMNSELYFDFMLEYYVASKQ